jgi:hypothetical protein
MGGSAYSPPRSAICRAAATNERRCIEREVGQRLVRLRALTRLGEMADRGDFDEFLDGKTAYRK